jgi:hypothetical protein
VPGGVVIIIGSFLLFGFLLFLVLRAKYWPHYWPDIFPDLKVIPRKPRPDRRRDASHPTTVTRKVGSCAGGSTATRGNVIGGDAKEWAAEAEGAIELQMLQ